MNKFSELRKEKGFSQKELAKALGIRQQSVSQWECGIAEPRLAVIAQVSELLESDYMTIVECFLPVRR